MRSLWDHVWGWISLERKLLLLLSTQVGQDISVLYSLCGNDFTQSPTQSNSISVVIRRLKNQCRSKWRHVRTQYCSCDPCEATAFYSFLSAMCTFFFLTILWVTYVHVHVICQCAFRGKQPQNLAKIYRLRAIFIIFSSKQQLYRSVGWLVAQSVGPQKFFSLWQPQLSQ